MFKKLQSSKQLNPEGFGLGLVICQKICQQLDSIIHVESKEKEGSTFHFTLQLETRVKEADAMSDVDELDERHVEEIDFSGQYLNENMNPIKKIENMGSSNLPKKDPRKYGAAAK
jgi:hypothetical protein